MSEEKTYARITTDYLSTLSKEKMIVLLEHRTRLLITANTLKIPNHAYVEELQYEVKALQHAIKDYSTVAHH
jgi:hypothetical protein